MSECVALAYFLKLHIPNSNSSYLINRILLTAVSIVERKDANLSPEVLKGHASEVIVCFMQATLANICFPSLDSVLIGA